MLRSIKDLTGYLVAHQDTKIGKVKDFLFDDQKWGVRYLVVDTGSWLSSKKVLVSPRHIEAPESEAITDTFSISLSQEDLASAPLLDECAPVSRQYEKEYARFHNHNPYWIGTDLWGAGAYPVSRGPNRVEIEEHEMALAEIEECHIRSTREVTGYRIRATDGDIGHVEDLIVDTGEWRLRYFVVDTRNWLPGRKVLIDIGWLGDFKWAEKSAVVTMARDQIKDSPKFDPSLPVNRDYEQKLYDFYGKPTVWRPAAPQEANPELAS